MSKPITCPNCGHEFNFNEAKISDEQRMIQVLHAHGFSLRHIGKVLGGLHPESVKYRIKEAERGRKV